MLLIAWRNLWRVPRRTILTMAALSLGTTGIAFLSAYRESAYGQMIHAVTTQLTGHLQVHGRGYQESPEINTVVPEPRLVEAALAKALPGVKSERRVIGAGLAGGNTSSAGVVVMGLETGQSATIFTVKKGRELGEVPKKEAVIGNELADELGLDVGSELVLVGQAADGSVANDRFTIVGVGDSGSSELNATSVFLHLADAQDFFGLGDAVHLVVLHLPTDEEDISSFLMTARSVLDLKSLEALSWNELLPEMKKTMDSKRKNQHSLDFIVFMLVSLGVLNVMTMSTFERTREFGVMLAVGTRPGRLLRLVVTEALLEGAIGYLGGVFLTFVLIKGLGTISLGEVSSSDMMGVRLPSIVQLHFEPVSLVAAAVTVGATMLVASFFPAWRASRLQPAVAVREA